MYGLRYDRRTLKELRPIPARDTARILSVVETLKDNPRRHGVEKMAGSEGYRIRIGDYRVLFTIDDVQRLVTVYRIKHRREVYR
ncbi:MAG: type II toxin-antitoxin system RelE/ParE family toxin [Candidatus Omnitrophica bacterium]|nr:type II toxin-antitoxin system RelE/ParE family toxin [Candidatus Omnitrophota bacterium]